MLVRHFDKILIWHLSDTHTKLSVEQWVNLYFSILVGLRTWRYHVRQMFVLSPSQLNLLLLFKLKNDLVWTYTFSLKGDV